MPGDAGEKSMATGWTAVLIALGAVILLSVIIASSLTTVSGQGGQPPVFQDPADTPTPTNTPTPSPTPTPNPDRDGDGLLNDAEVNTHGTDPDNPDLPRYFGRPRRLVAQIAGHARAFGHRQPRRQ